MINLYCTFFSWFMPLPTAIYPASRLPHYYYGHHDTDAGEVLSCVSGKKSWRGGFSSLYSRVLLKRSLIYHDITNSMVAEHKSLTELAIDTPCIALTGELWGVYCWDLGENRRRYKSTALYHPHAARRQGARVHSNFMLYGVWQQNSIQQILIN